VSSPETNVLPFACFGNVLWFYHFLQEENPVLDQHEHFRKQTWRNRYRIIGPNGIQDLTVPVVYQGNHVPMQDVKIDYSERWQQKHWGAIKAAYGQSPFFSFYADYFEPLFSDPKTDRLIDYNKAILQVCLRLLKVKKEILCSQSFKLYAENDLRTIISPKSNLESVTIFKPYIQVFGDRHGFVPNLSILDLLFCNGNLSLEIINATGK
jgi:hypothetical protein